MLTLVDEDDSILKLKMPEFDFLAEFDLMPLLDQMFESMIINDAIGLAAPQCGLMLRLFVMNVNKNKVCINPRIISRSNILERNTEGCLSFPNLWLKIQRDTEITVEYHDRYGKLINENMRNLEARCFLHELDHLNGIRFVDLIGPLAYKLANSRRTKGKLSERTQ